MDSCKDVPLAVTIATFHTPWSLGPLKGQNLERKYSLDFAFNIRGHEENTPYSSSEPNESDTVNRQNGGEKLKYVGLLKFYIGVHITWYRACAMTTTQHCLCEHMMFEAGQNISETLTDSEFRPTANRMVVWPMTSPDPGRSMSWPNALTALYLNKKYFRLWPI